MPNKNSFGYRWYVLILSASLGALAVAMPEICMSVLFKEISEELNLDLVQIGTVWGIVPLGSVASLIIGGAICDRFGVRHAQRLHDVLAQVVGFQIDQQVVMIGHQAIGQYVRVGRREIASQAPDEKAPVLVAKKDRPCVSSVSVTNCSPIGRSGSKYGNEPCILKEFIS